MSSFRQLMMNKSGGGELTGYVQSNDGAYIDLYEMGLTNFWNTDTVGCVFQIPEADTMPSGSKGIVYGFKVSSYVLELHISPMPRIIFINKGSNTSTALEPVNAKHTYETTTGISTNTSARHLWLFGAFSSLYSNVAVRIWNFYVIRNNEKIVDLVPAIENGEVGFKDLISGKFAGNHNTVGSLTYGE